MNLLISSRSFGKALLTLMMMLFLHSAFANVPHATEKKGFVGAETCKTCHSDTYQEWQTSHHAKAMMVANKDSVLGDFSGVSFTHEGVKSTFTTKGGKYFITTQSLSGKQQTFPVIHTFGYVPLQQYLLDIGEGKLQAFDVAWDSRSKAEGGQRWFKLLPKEDTSPDSHLHWQRYLMNWNSRCADCHSTALDKGYEPASHSYNTTYSEINVACESCHGPGQGHVDWVKGGKSSSVDHRGFDARIKSAIPFAFKDGANIATSDQKPIRSEINSCASCHSRRAIIDGDNQSVGNYHDKFQLRLLDQDFYHPHGRIQEEVFVLGSFMQSKMYEAGVTCSNCHNPHSGELKAEGNGLCAQCHKPSTYDTPDHHKHPVGSTGAQCVTCHMPTETYMEVDPRRDHRFHVPEVAEDLRYGVDSVCSSCHAKQGEKWVNDHLKKWVKKPTDPQYIPFGDINAHARDGNPVALMPMKAYIENENNPIMQRATLMALAGRITSRVSAELIAQQIRSPEPVMRRAAVSASQFFPMEFRWQLIKSRMNDPVRTVRHEVARQLLGFRGQMTPQESKQLTNLIREYEKALKAIEDTPAGQSGLSVVAMSQGDTIRAERALKKALVIEPLYVPAMMNLADLYRSQGKKDQARVMLEKAIKAAPESGAAHFGLGLYWLRQKDTERGLQFLKIATEQTDRTPRYFYVYSVALESVGQLDQAISVLQTSNRLWKNQYETLMLLIQYLEKAGRDREVLPYLSDLSRVAPSDPEVKRRIQQYQQQ